MSSDFLQQLEVARRSIVPAWDVERAAAVRAGMPHRARAKRRRRAVTATVAMLIIGVTATVGWRLGATAPEVGVSALSADAAWRAGAVVAGVHTVELSRGGARFDSRLVQARVIAGTVEVEGTGARFAVEYQGEKVRVAVEEGVVFVRVAGLEVRSVAQGEEVFFSRLKAEAAAAPPQPSPPAASPEPERGPPSRVAPVVAPSRPKPSPAVMPPAKPEWQHLAKAGDFDAAWVAMKASPPPADEVSELLLAADVARLSRHADDAVAPLQRILDTHAVDPRAPLAAFTLGRVLLDELGRPREAAAAFGAVRRLDATSALVEDALAREVEAQSSAGEAPTAHELALEYVRKYPTGARLRAVKHYGGL